MPFIENWLKNKKEAAQRTVGAPVSPEAREKQEGPTVKEILADKAQAELFGEYLEEEGAKGIAKKILEGKLSAKDLETLAEQRKGFLAVTERAKRFSEKLDASAMQELVERSPDLQKLATVSGKEDMRSALLERMPSIAIRDRARFDSLDSAMAAVGRSKDILLADNKNIEAFCKKYKVSDKDLEAAFNSSNPNAVKELALSHIGFIRGIFMKEENLQKELAMIDRKEVINQRIATLDRDMGNLGSAMKTMLSTNPEVRAALTASLRGNEQKEADPRGFANTVDTMKKVEKIKLGEVKNLWEQYRSGREHLDGYSEEEARQEFSEQYAAEQMGNRKRPGFWAKIAAALFASTVEDILKTN